MFLRSRDAITTLITSIALLVMQGANKLHAKINHLVQNKGYPYPLSFREVVGTFSQQRNVFAFLF